MAWLPFLISIITWVCGTALDVALNYVVGPALNQFFWFTDVFIGVFAEKLGLTWPGWSGFAGLAVVKAAAVILVLADGWLPVYEYLFMSAILMLLWLCMYVTRICLRLYHEIPSIFGWTGGRT